MTPSVTRVICTCFALAGLIAAQGLPASAASSWPRHSEKQAKVEKTKPGSDERADFTAADVATAKPEGLPGPLRFYGDDRAAFQNVVDSASLASAPWLVLSGGGENGAFAAGILSGWTQAGNRPDFGVITGVSTGALIAPFAFVGPSADAELKRNYTEITAADVFEFGGTKAALTDSWPLKARIDQFVTPDLLRAVAAEHAKGRRLLVATTLVDSERATVWDMGAIASLASGPEAKRYGDKALKLFREVILASTAIPGVFPPVMIDAVGQNGKVFQEMHDDGGAMAPFYLAPASAIAGEDGKSFDLPTRTVYLIVNNRLDPEFGLAPRSVLGVLGRTMSGAIKAQTQAALALTQSFAKRTGIDLRLAIIDQRFNKASSGPFDQDYMKALFAYGENLARTGTAFRTDRTAAPVGNRSKDVKETDATSTDLR